MKKIIAIAVLLLVPSFALAGDYKAPTEKEYYQLQQELLKWQYRAVTAEAQVSQTAIEKAFQEVSEKVRDVESAEKKEVRPTNE